MLLAFYNGTFVSNTDFKKQTLLSQRRRCRCCGCWLRRDCSLFATFAFSFSLYLSLFISFPAPCFFLFRAWSTAKGVWQNLNCETNVGRKKTRSLLSKAPFSHSLSISLFLFPFLVSFISFFSRLVCLFAHHLRLVRSRVSGCIKKFFCHRMLIKISAIMILSFWALFMRRFISTVSELIFAVAQPDEVVTQ